MRRPAACAATITSAHWRQRSGLDGKIVNRSRCKCSQCRRCGFHWCWIAQRSNSATVMNHLCRQPLGSCRRTSSFMATTLVKRFQELFDGFPFRPEGTVQNGYVGNGSCALLRHQLLDGWMTCCGIMAFLPACWLFKILAIRFCHVYHLALSNRKMAPRHGFEPRLTAPKAAVLPLDDRGTGSSKIVYQFAMEALYQSE